MTNTVGGSAPEQRDEWAAGFAPGTVDAVAAGLPDSVPKTGLPYKPIHALVAALVVVSAILQTVWLFVGKLTLASTASNYRFPQEDVGCGLLIVLCLVIAVCITARATREFGLALALVGAIAMVGTNLHDLRPSQYVGADATPAQDVYGLALLFVFAGGLTAAIEWRHRSLKTPPAPKARHNLRLTRKQRLLCLLAGVFGAVPFMIGTALTTVFVSLTGTNESFSCCSFSARFDWQKADYFGLAAVVVVFVIFAAIDRSRVRSVAWLAGPALVGLSTAAVPLVEAIWPVASFNGFGATQPTQVQLELLAGSWLTLVGTLALLAAAAILAGLDRTAADPYSRSVPNAASA